MAAKKLNLVFDDQNANRGTERGKVLLKRSIESYGAGRSILTDKNGRVIAGNKTLEAAQAAGLKTRFVETDGGELVVVVRTDLSLDERKARELAYADNRVAEVDLEWDSRQIAADLEAGIGLDGLFLSAELDAMLGASADESAIASTVAEGPASVDERVASTGTQQVVLTFQVEEARRFFEQVRALIKKTDGAETITDVVKKVVDEAYRTAHKSP